MRLPRMKEIRKAPKSVLRGFTESKAGPDEICSTRLHACLSSHHSLLSSLLSPLSSQPHAPFQATGRLKQSNVFPVMPWPKVNPDTVPYADKAREKARIKALADAKAAALANPEVRSSA